MAAGSGGSYSIIPSPLELLDFGPAKLHEKPAPFGISSLTRLDALNVTTEGAVLGTWTAALTK
jgi:hypothetical protein